MDKVVIRVRTHTKYCDQARVVKVGVELVSYILLPLPIYQPTIGHYLAALGWYSVEPGRLLVVGVR